MTMIKQSIQTLSTIIEAEISGALHYTIPHLVPNTVITVSDKYGFGLSDRFYKSPFAKTSAVASLELLYRGLSEYNHQSIIFLPYENTSAASLSEYY
ncbi:hypothetical protein D5086_015500 [Populus alba]|uniref:Uncharacterized protein n=1 Tax=Populus alba TaxID=43335 RepID=A0ACC4BRC2_POPAL